ncbi:uncharacterized protein isoform X2 [Leptinotarsa decemlineata]|uniref:uncharacterized protein isoform X2 n=1 Tax=Leptinotarsa decemlineata TaxID=7539 RepID=UPI003D30C31D
MDGSSVLREYAALCGAENPKTLTSSRLKKQIATVLQVINLNETEKEQVASFMGHTKKTHEELYRLPQDVFQTAKIAKLLLMMDKGEGADFKGKTLEEIDIHLDNLEEENCPKIESDIGNDFKRKIMGKKTKLRGSWSSKQKSLMEKFFKKHICEKITPKKEECLQLRNEYTDMFEDKTWVQIKVFIYNTFRKEKK